MDVLLIPAPLFNRDIAVEAYYFRHRKGNDIIMGGRIGGHLDGAMRSPPLEILNLIGLEAFTLGKPIFVPINQYMLLSRLELQCSQPAEKIIFLLDDTVPQEPPYLKAIRRLRDLGYRFGIQKITSEAAYSATLEYCDFIFLDHRIFDDPQQIQLRADLDRFWRGATRVYTHIADMERFREVSGRYKGLFEGRFYRVPLTRGDNKVSPLQQNLINLLNVIRDEYFDFMDVANVIRCDAALSISLLSFINSPSLGLRHRVRNIHHAVTILGQDEVRKWATSAVSRLLGTDKPNEITRLSLIRARFCEAIAPLFGLDAESQGIYLMGLFSLLDVVLDRPMKDALQAVHVSDSIYDALTAQTGDYGGVYRFMLQYEAADWNAVSRALILLDARTDDIYRAYVESQLWYRDLLTDDAANEEEFRKTKLDIV